MGYRAIDTAQSYGNEAEIGSILAELGVARDELCITTKVRPENFGQDVFIASIERSLSDLRIDCVDVLLLHWPPLDGDISRPLALLDQARERGLTKHVGVSNYTSPMMRQAAVLAGGPLVTNQVEFHPLLNQDILLAAAAETGIPLASYCSVARGEVFAVPLFDELAKELRRQRRTNRLAMDPSERRLYQHHVDEPAAYQAQLRCHGLHAIVRGHGPDRSVDSVKSKTCDARARSLRAGVGLIC